MKQFINQRFTPPPMIRTWGVAIMFTAIGLLSSCTKELDEDVTLVGSDPTTEEAVVLPTRNLEEAVYHEGAAGWMVPQKDPYTLENFRAAYEKLLSGGSTQKLTRAQTDELAAGAAELKATHYALRIFPKNEDEQWKIELMEDVNVTYMPFDYVQLSEEEVKSLPTAKTRAGEGGKAIATEAAVFPESYRNTITYTGLQTSEGPVPDETYILPILYAVWPVEKPLPTDMEYEVDYEIFRPDYEAAKTRSGSGLGTETLLALEDEAIALALGTPVKTRALTRANPVITVKGDAMTEDFFLLKQSNWTKSHVVPLANLKISIQLGSSIWETYSQSDGRFSITQTIPLDATLYTVNQHPKWKITNESSTSPISSSSGTSLSKALNPNFEFQLGHFGGTWSVDVIHRAVNYFYNNSHSIPAWYYSSGIRIIAAFYDGDAYSAEFWYSTNASAYIKVYNNYTPWTGYEQDIFHDYLFGAVCHELGHFVHYCERGWNFYDFRDTVHPLIKESFASYVGYYLVERYYCSLLGWTKPYAGFTLSAQGRQTWNKTNSSTYSPLFVDLIDDYNQYTTSSSRPNDAIKNFPHSIIRTMAAECPNWSSVKTKLQQYTGTYYTSTELNNYISNYDYWSTRN